ncbi:MAG: hypothetical protein HKN87_12565 [Saprospiraceae bacterium]|nr:hypothetical protein [Saprospiraceae bacterium]
MRVLNKRPYPAKILLFGEYTVLHGGSALAVPYHRYVGRWADAIVSPYHLQPFFDHLSTIQIDLHAQFDKDLVQELQLRPLSFDSDIPVGQGLGSSAALTAATYDLASTLPDPLALQKSDLALIEGFFHGTSSGVDALVCYRDAPIYRSAEGLEETHLPSRQALRAYLWITGQARSTEPLVAWFQEALTNQAFKSQVERLAQYSSTAVDQLLQGELTLADVKNISNIQWQHMSALIPSSVRHFWQGTLDDEHVAIKLCGAGGGGSFLLFSDGVDLCEKFPDYMFERLW